MVIVIANQKGGVGKTTTALAMFAGMQKCLGIDLDPQGSFTALVRADEDVQNIHNVLNGDCSIQEATQHLALGDFVASSPALINPKECDPMTLANALKSVAGSYKHVIIDTPPFFCDVTMNALSAADILIVPILADLLSLRGLNQLADIVDATRKNTNPTLRIGGLLLTQYTGRSVLRRQMSNLVEQFAKDIGTRVFKTTIRQAIAIPKSQAVAKDIFSYDEKSKVAADYRAFIRELEEEGL